MIESYVALNYDNYKRKTTSTQDPIDAVNELNSRFKESGVGYQFESGELIRIDSQFIHSEAVKPVLHLLHQINHTKELMTNFFQLMSITGTNATKNVLTIASSLLKV